MAFSPSQMYPGFVSTDAAYKDGKYKDCSAPSFYDGTPINELLHNQYLAFWDATFNAAQLDYSNSVDTPANSQLFTALEMTRSAENRLVGNQNFNVRNDTTVTLPNGTSRTYTVGTEFSAGKFVISSSLVSAKYTAGVFSATSGSYYVQVLGDFTDNFYGVKKADGTISKTGVTISLVSGYTRLTVNMATAGPHKFAGISEKLGVWPDVSNEESAARYTGLVDISLVIPVIYTYNGDEPATIAVRSNLPTNITTQTRYVLNNPFGTNVRFHSQAEIYINGIWTPVIGGFAGDNDSTGVISGYVRDVGLVVQTGRNALANAAYLTLNLSGNTATTSSAPCRIWCYRG